MLHELINHQNHINNKIRIHKGILRLISTPQFMELFQTASEEQQKYILHQIEENNKISIQIWIRNETGEKNLTELRMLGKKYMIKNYGRITKRELIRELSKYA